MQSAYRFFQLGTTEQATATAKDNLIDIANISEPHMGHRFGKRNDRVPIYTTAQYD
jgi:hypothetical protein